MLVIHTCPIPRDWCPACGKVIKAANQLGLEYERKKYWTTRDRRTEVIELTGQNRVPVIQDGDFVMRESSDIVEYLHEKYGKPSNK